MAALRTAALAFALALALAAGCSGASKGLAPADPEAPDPRRAEPVAVHDPATAASLANDPAWALVLATGEGARADRIPLLPGQRAAEVRVPMAGALATVRLRVEGTGTGTGTGAGTGTGTGTGSSVVPAARAAASALNKAPGALSFAATSDAGTIDLSAGPALAGGFVAALTGAAIDPTFALSGLLYPDGAIGPAPDHHRRAEAAAAAGIRRLGVAPGSGAQSRRDMTARKVEDVVGAYQLLTGEELPRPLPAPEAAMELSGAEEAAIAEELAAWRRRVAPRFAKALLVLNEGGVPAQVSRLASRAESSGDRAERAARAGQVAAAHERMLEAAIAAEAAALAADATRPAAARAAWAHAIEVLDEVDREAAVVLAEAVSAAGDLTAQLARVEAAERALEAALLAGTARARFDSLREALEKPAPGKLSPEVGTELAAAAVALARARAAAWHARALTGTGTGTGSRRCEITACGNFPAAPPERSEVTALSDDLLGELAAAYADHAGAILDAPEASRAAGTPDLELAVAALARARDSGSGVEALAAALVAHRRAAEAVLLAASLEAELDPATGAPVSVGQARALPALLGVARRKAREHARAAAQVTGAIPARARRAYLAGRALAASADPGERARALTRFWEASLASRLAVEAALTLSPGPTDEGCLTSPSDPPSCR